MLRPINLYETTTFKTTPKLKAFAEDNFNFAKMMTSFFDRVGNVVGKGENAHYHYFLLFPHFFSKAFSLRVFDSLVCVVKG